MTHNEFSVKMGWELRSRGIERMTLRFRPLESDDRNTDQGQMEVESSQGCNSSQLGKRKLSMPREPESPGLG